MSRHRIIIKTALLIAALVVGLTLGWFAREFSIIDHCLDRGGKWNYGGVSCELAAKSGKPEESLA